MSLPEILGKLLPTGGLDGSRNVVRDAWNLLENVPGGRAVFSRLIGRAAPYTATIGATVVALRPGFAQVELADRKAVRNHLACVHAIALANLAELTGNVGLAYSLADDARFIVAGMSIDYVKKARGLLTATSECPIPAGNARQEFDVPVSIRDAAGDEVARAVLRTLVGPKPGAAVRSRAAATPAGRVVN
jgi:acyl-coenzyme A thioesterase PaaI-like protein